MKFKISYKTEESFTLIELLVVIAIIGILAGIVLVALGGARVRARDARIMSDMHQFRTTAAIIFSNNSNYDDVDCTIGNINILCDDMAVQGGINPESGAPGVFINKTSSPADQYCAEVLLNSGKYWCVDSGSISAQYTGRPRFGGEYCHNGGASPNYACE